MTVFEFYVSMIITALAVFALVVLEPIFSKWYLRIICVLLIFGMSHFAGLHGGVLK